MMTPGTLTCSASSMVTAPQRAISAAVTVETVPGTLPIASSLPVTGDILTKPASTLSGTAAVAGVGLRLRLGPVLDFCFATGGVTMTCGKPPACANVSGSAPLADGRTAFCGLSWAAASGAHNTYAAAATARWALRGMPGEHLCTMCKRHLAPTRI